MQKVTVEYEVYKYQELSREAKDKALAVWYENETYDFLHDDITESCKKLLRKHKTAGTPELHYSLSWSQGDGLCFTGSFVWRKQDIRITHNARYYYAESVNIAKIDKDGNEMDAPAAFLQIYLDICRQLEKEGYSVLEYRMSDDEMAEHCEVNGYNFFKDGRMANL